MLDVFLPIPLCVVLAQVWMPCSADSIAAPGCGTVAHAPSGFTDRTALYVLLIVIDCVIVAYCSVHISAIVFEVTFDIGVEWLDRRIEGP